MDVDTEFFLPRPWLRVDERAVRRDVAFQRGSGTPHVCESVYRAGGERVYVKGTIHQPGRGTMRLGHWHQMVSGG